MLGNTQTAWQAIAQAAAHPFSLGQQGVGGFGDIESMPGIAAAGLRSVPQPKSAAEAAIGLKASAMAAKRARRCLTAKNCSVTTRRRHPRSQVLRAGPSVIAGLLVQEANTA